MKRTKHITKIFGHGNIRIDATVTTEKGRMVGFSVNLSVLVGEERIDVARWDTSHGFLHRHEFWRTHRCIRERRYEGMPLEIVLDKVRDDIKRNMKRYIKKVLEHKKKRELISMLISACEENGGV